MEAQSNHTYQNNSNDTQGLSPKEFVLLYWRNWPLILFFSFMGVALAQVWNKTLSDRFQISTVINIKAEEQPILSQSPISFLNRNDNLIDPKIAILKSFEHNMQVVKELGWEVSYFNDELLKNNQLFSETAFSIEIDKDHIQIVEVPFYVDLQEDSFSLIVDEELLNQSNRHYLHNKQEFVYRDFSMLEGGNFPYNEWLETASFRFKLTPNEGFLKRQKPEENSFFFTFEDYQSLAKANIRGLSVNTNNLRGSFNNSGIMTLIAEGFAKQRLTQYLNTTVNILQINELEDKNARINRTIDFIDTQLTKLRDSLQQAESQLQDFRSDNQVVDLSTEASQVFTQLVGLEQDRAELILQKDYFDYLQNYLNNNNDFSRLSIPSVVVSANPNIIDLTNQLAELSLQKTRISFSLKPENPAFQSLEQQLAQVAQQLRDNVKGLKETNQISLDKLEDRISEIESRFSDIPQTEQTLINLRRRYELINNLFTILLERKSDADIRRSSNTTNIQIIDPARDTGQPATGPSKIRNLILGLLLGTLFPIGLISFRNYFDNKIQSSQQIKSKISFPIAGEIVHSDTKDDLLPLDNSKLISSEGFRSLRTNLNFLISKTDQKTKLVMVASGMSGEGKTFISNNLGNVIAKNNKATLIISADLRKANSLKVFGISPQIGLTNYLAGEATLDELINPTDIPNLYVIASGPPPPNPSELISSKIFRGLLNDLVESERFDYVIIDTPPILLFSDALHISQLCDHGLYVVRQGQTPTSTLDFVAGKHREGVLNNLSVVVNDIKMSRKSGYGYGSSYYGSYSTYGYSTKKRSFWGRIKRALGLN